MAYDIALDAKTHDLVINENDFIMIDNAERVAQQIKITLLFWLGEWFLNTSFGIPYLEQVLVKNPNLIGVYEIFRAKIRDVPGVNSIDQLDLYYNPRERLLTVEFSVNTLFGQITRREVLGYGTVW